MGSEEAVARMKKLRFTSDDLVKINVLVKMTELLSSSSMDCKIVSATRQLGLS